MKTTISDVANRANVSKATVSRYLNGKYEFMSIETKESIKKVIDELEYKPNIMARTLKSRKSKIIGCTIADIGNQFSTQIFKGISDVCKENGYRVLVMDISNNEEDEKEAIESLISYNIDGLIINTTGSNDNYLLELKKRNVMPIVLADRSFHEKNVFDTVTSNNYESTYNSIRHFKENNYDVVAFFGYSLAHNYTRKRRYEGYLDAMKIFFDCSGEEFTYILENKESDKCIEFLKDFLDKNKNKRVGIFCINGTLLLEILQNLRKLDYNLEKIGICSFDDWGWAELIAGGITTINQDSYRCGRKCAELLIERMKNIDKDVEYIEIPTNLIIRKSTKNEGGL